MDKVVLQALGLNSKVVLPNSRFLTRRQLNDTIKKGFTQGVGDLDYALSTLKTLNELVRLSKQTSVATTNNVRVQCTSIAKHPDTSKLVFNSEHRHDFIYYYRIKIENIGEIPVQLLGRMWEFRGGQGERAKKTILPRWQEGVIGETPVLGPRQGFTYMSSTVLHDPSGGSMSGAFNFLDCAKQTTFEVSVGETLLLPQPFH